MCVLHIDPAIIGEIRQFENDTWAKVNDAVSQRQTLFRESKYFKIKLEYIVSDMDGYHVQCYGNFTAVLKVTVEDSSAETKQGNLRSDSNFQSLSSSGIFPHECLFCRKVWKSQGKFRARDKLGKFESFQASDIILAAVRTLNDSSMLSRICGINMIAKGVKYHHSCRKTHLQQASRWERMQSKNVLTLSDIRTIEALRKSVLSCCWEDEHHIWLQ